MAKYISGRSKLTSQTRLTEDRYRYLNISESEPNLGDPIIGVSSLGAKPAPFGDKYQLVSVDGYPGERYWIPVGGGIIPGSITVFEEGTRVGGASSTTELNFEGSIVTAIGDSPFAPNPGVGVTIRIVPPGNDTEVLFKDLGDFTTDSSFTFDSTSNLLTAGDRLAVGAGGTVITTTGIGSVGIGTTQPVSRLHVQGDLKLSGTIIDRLGDDGLQGYILAKDAFGGLVWINPNSIQSGAGGELGQIQYHNSAGLVDGADNFYFDYINNRIGIGSTQPTQLLDVLGVSTFSGGVFVDEFYVSDLATFYGNIDAYGNLDVDGYTELDDLNVSGISTFTSDLDINASVNILNNLDVDGLSNLDELIVSGLSTFTKFIDAQDGIDVTGQTELDNLNVTGIATFSQLDLDNAVFTNLLVTGISTLGNIKVQSNTIYTNSGALILDSNLNSVQIDSTDILSVNNTTQSSSKDTGALIVEGGVGIEKNLYVGQKLNVIDTAELNQLIVTGVSTFNGNVDLGDNVSDTVTFTALVDSDIIPSQNNTYSLGSIDNKWEYVYAENFSGSVETASYATRAGLSTDLEINATNQLLYQSSNNSTNVIAQGVAGQLLQSNGGITEPSWISKTDITIGLAVTATNLEGGSAGSIPYQDGPGSTTFLDEPDIDGYVLSYNNTTNAPEWVNPLDVAGIGYTFFAVDSGDNVILRMSDGSTDDDILITAGTGITIDTVTENGFTLSSSGTSGSLPSGTRMLFYQASAPTGWTKITSHNDKALRVVSGTGGGSGGSTAFSTVFTSRSPSGTVSSSLSGSTDGASANISIISTNVQFTISNTTLTTSQMPSHTHTLNGRNDPNGDGGAVEWNSVFDTDRSGGVNSTGGSSSHTHSYTQTVHGHPISQTDHSHNLTGSISGTFVGDSMDFAVEYIDVIICEKD